MGYLKRSKHFFFHLIIVSIFLNACFVQQRQSVFKSEEKLLTFFNDFDNDSIASSWHLNQNMLSGDTNKFEHFEPNDLYGSNFKFEIPDSFQSNSIVVKINFKYRLNSSLQGIYVFTVKSDDKQILWEGKDLVGDSGKWQFFEDSLVIPVVREPNSKLGLYAYNPKKSSFDIDSVTIRIGNKIFPSYLKDVHANLNSLSTTPLNTPMFESVGLMAIVDSQYVESEVKQINDSTIQFSNDYFEMKWNCLGGKYQGRSNTYFFGSETEFKKPTKINRLALIYKYKGQVTEVYRNNRIASPFFGNEVWLGKQGFKLNSDSLAWFSYGNQNVSSLQLSKDKKILVANIDWSHDHPLLHFPEQDSATGDFKDISANEYALNGLNTKIFHNIVFYSGKKERSMPRILPTKNGCQAAYLWTEHADFADFRLHKITYYGNENASGPSQATAGFAARNIPVTKSVFYTVNDTLQNEDYHYCQLPSELASIKKTHGFEAFLDSLHAIGNEICLHTPDFFTTDSALMDEALEYITKRYGSHTWIDHGYNNGHSDNREDFMCDGLNSYAKYLWVKHDIRYFWNGYFEDKLPQQKFRFSQSRTIPYHGFEDQLPYPLSWENLKTEQGMYSWRTSTVFFPNSGSSWNYYFSDEKLADFVNNYGVEFNHVYPAHTGHPGFWTFDADSNLIIQPEFDLVLQKMAILRDQGLLEIPTVSNFMEYQHDIERVKIDINETGFQITNDNRDDIVGLTLTIKAKNLSNDFKTQFKGTRLHGDDIIFWFDIKAGEDLRFHW